VVLVDDALLLALIAERDEPSIAPYLAQVTAGEVFTTGSWFWRLARALSEPGRGVLSRQLASLGEDERQRVRIALADLPPEIGLLSLRRLVPVMSALGGPLNLLTAEAIAAAVVLESGIAVTTESPLLAQAAAAAGVTVRVVPLFGGA
jgi:hypothetical protein